MPEQQENLVSIVAWPSEGTAKLDMDMDIKAKEPIPVCIKLCEPICVSSEYKIDIKIFDNPFAGITIRGQTKLFSCNDDNKPI